MTIQEIKATEKPFLTCADIAPDIGSDPHALRLEARQNEYNRQQRNEWRIRRWVRN